ncbi:MAG: electron transfer flavoprotein subunit alpha [Gammaproteobacteria bacterium]|nr:MAG: electron transfer flavoprotein subunit alpha [Gammaproteobacteria bacterium]
MAILVIVEGKPKSGQTLSPVNFAVINAVQQLSQPVHAIVVGGRAEDCATQLSTIKGVDQVFYAETPGDHWLAPEQLAVFLKDFIDAHDYSHIVAAANFAGKNLIPRLAALLGNEPVTEVISIIDDETFERLSYAGRLVETWVVKQEQQLLTVKHSHFSSDYQRQHPVSVVKLGNFVNQPEVRCAQWLKNIDSEDRADLSTAKIIVAAGAGIATQGEFEYLIKPLAKALNAGIGGSRIAVDKGYCGSDGLIGQTGKSVAPALYIAIGISGANQHLAGMQASKCVVVINSDSQAPFFQHADYGLVADAKAVVPVLIDYFTKKHLTGEDGNG